MIRIHKLITVVALMVFTVSLAAQFAGGSGTAQDPWQIQTATHLSNIRDYIGEDHQDKHFTLTANIDLGVPPWNDDEGWQPIGSFGNRFGGTFNGDDYIISNLTIDRVAQYQGLFGYTQEALIKNIGLIDVNINGGESTGAVAGYMRESQVRDSYAIGEISGTVRVGLIAGYKTGSHTLRSFSAGRSRATEGNGYVGGLVGYQTGGSSITDSYSTAMVVGERSYIGGIVGTNFNGSLVRTYANGYVTAEENPNNIGGLIGSFNQGSVTNSYWNIQTTGRQTSAGGGEGKVTTEMLEEDTFQHWDFDDVWTIGHQGDDTYPYFISQSEPIDSNYPSMLPADDFFVWVSGHQQITGQWSHPIVGEPDSYLIYRGEDLAGEVGGHINTFQDDGLILYTRHHYHVVAVYDGVESPPSQIAYAAPVTDGYAGGRGTSDQPYRLRTAQQLAYARFNPHRNFVLSEDVNLQDIGNWTPIGGSSADDHFTGTFDGNGYVISNLLMDGNVTFNLGLFGTVRGAVIENITLENVTLEGRRTIGGLAARATDGALIRNCRVINVDITATDTGGQLLTGGLIGAAENVNVVNCSVEGGDVESDGSYVGGLIGNFDAGTIENSFATCRVEGRSYIGGFAGYARGTIKNSYALGQVNASSSEVGGFIGGAVAATVTNSYSIGRMMIEEAPNIGGFVGRTLATSIEGCYWNVENSGIDHSAAGIGRNTEQMTYPYAEDTYADWDFDELWVADFQGFVNNGYPYHRWYPIDASDYPGIAVNPNPADEAQDISADIDSLRWEYRESVMFTDPSGFRIYLNTTGEFEDDDDYTWVAYDEDASNYGTGEALPELLDYYTIYYWKVVPTTRGADEGSGRGDAENVPVWRFRTESSPHPDIASQPDPEHEADEVPLDLERLSWSYSSQSAFTNPAGFRVYFSTSEQFDEEYEWVAYEQGQNRYHASNILPDSLDFGRKYYWKIVPTTDGGDNRSHNRRRLTTHNSQLTTGDSQLFSRGDAENVPVWTFTSVDVSPNPTIAVNPDPEHTASGISPEIDRVSWDYIPDPAYTNPAGFRVYMNTTGQFGTNAPYVWVDYEDGEISYYSENIIPEPVEVNTTYYWRVVPTTEYPDRSETRNNYRHRSANLVRGDAEDVPIWRFTTAETSIDIDEPIAAETRLTGNYPNPFNPETVISFNLAENSPVLIEIFNARGQRVNTVLDADMMPGKHEVIWNGTDSNGQPLSSGLYYARLIVNETVKMSQKMMLLK